MSSAQAQAPERALLRRVVLDNGLTVFVQPMRTAPLASVWCWYKVGSKDERRGQTGVSHWVEHMNFKGTTNIPRDQVKGIIEQFGGMWNGYTWLDQTTYLETATRDALDRMVREQVGIDFLWRRVAASPVYRHFAEGAPGLEQVAVLGHALRRVRGIGLERLGGRLRGAVFDLVVLDAPATGHGVSLNSPPMKMASAVGTMNSGLRPPSAPRNVEKASAPSSPILIRKACCVGPRPAGPSGDAGRP